MVHVFHMVCTLLSVFSAFFNTMATSKNGERTFIMVKPDGVQRGLIGDIVKRFEQRGYKMVASKFMKVGKTKIQITIQQLNKA